MQNSRKCCEKSLAAVLYTQQQQQQQEPKLQQLPEFQCPRDKTVQTDSADVLAGRGATAAMRIRSKYFRTLGVCTIPRLSACLKNEVSDLALGDIRITSSRWSSCSTCHHSGSRRSSTSSSKSGRTKEVEEYEGDDSISCSSACSDSSDSSEDAGRWPRRQCKACLLRGLSWGPVLHQPPKSQTITIFDWDDTLLCTSVLTCTSAGYDHGYPPLPPMWLLPDLARAAADLLEAACSLGPTFIITNALEGWVERSAQRWVPTLLPALDKVTEIISARSRYEWQDLDIQQWKLHAFLELQRSLDPRPVTNLIVVGDSDYEMDAARAMASQFPQAVVKTVKFKPTPMVLDLLRELELFREKLDQIVEAGSNLQIQLDRKPPRKPQEANADSEATPELDGDDVTPPAAAHSNRMARRFGCC